MSLYVLVYYVKLFVLHMFAVLLVAGCVNTGQMYEDFANSDALDELPEGWSGTFVAGSVEQSWVISLADESLTRLVRQALTDNFVLRSQAQLVGQRYAQADAASGGSLPNIDASVTARRSAANSERSPDDYLYTNVFDASLRLVWNPDIWGKLGADGRAAAYNLEAALANFQRQRNAQLASLVMSWIELVVCRQLVALYEERIERANELLDAANQSYTLGLESLLAVRNQEIVLANEQRALLTQARQCRDVERTMAVALGSMPSTHIVTPDALPPLPAAPAAGIPADLLMHRGDLIQARANLKAAYEHIASARAARFPSLSISASGARNNDEFMPLFADNVQVFSIAAGMTIPIYAFGRLEAQENAQYRAAAQAEIGYVQALYYAIKEVESLLDAEANLTSTIAIAQRSFGLATDSALIAEQQYTAGVSDFDSWVGAELSRFNSLATLLGITRERWKTRVELHVALGSVPLPDATTDLDL